MDGEGNAQSLAIVPFNAGDDDVNAAEPGAFEAEDMLTKYLVCKPTYSVGSYLLVVAITRNKHYGNVWFAVSRTHHMYPCIQDLWMAKINEMLAAIPLDLEESAVKQRERKLSIDRLRVAIAERWHHAFQLKAVLPVDD